MSIIRPFKGIRPRADLASAIAALPYDVYNSEGSRERGCRTEVFFFRSTEPRRFFQRHNPYSEAVYKQHLKH